MCWLRKYRLESFVAQERDTVWDQVIDHVWDIVHSCVTTWMSGRLTQIQEDHRRATVSPIAQLWSNNDPCNLHTTLVVLVLCCCPICLLYKHYLKAGSCLTSKNIYFCIWYFLHWLCRRQLICNSKATIHTLLQFYTECMISDIYK